MTIKVKNIGKHLSVRRLEPIESSLVTEDSAATAFVAQHGKDLRFCHTSGKWFRWNGSFWAEDRVGATFQEARELARALSLTQDDKKRYATSKTAFAASLERFAKVDPKIAVTTESWDLDTFLIGTPDGTVDLRTGILRASKREDMITKATRISPSNEGCPLWLKFLAETTNNDPGLIRFLQQWCGYSLTGDTREESIVFVYGSGGNGRSTFLSTVRAILDVYVAVAPMTTFVASKTDRHPTELAMLKGARFVMASETEKGRPWAEARIKQLTGRDPITARFMNRNFFTYDPEFKLTIVGNDKPALRNVDDATRRRFIIVPFLQKPLIPDLVLRQKLEGEYGGIFQWMIEGCLDWQTNGLIRPDTVVAETNNYFFDQDTFLHWRGEACDCELTNRSKSGASSELYQSWRRFAIAAGAEAGSQTEFTDRMIRDGFEYKRTSKARIFLGIRLRPIGPFHDRKG